MPLFKHRKGKEPASTRTELRPDLTQPSTAPPPGTGSPVPQKEVVRVRAKAEPETAQPAEVMVQVMAPPLPPSSEVCGRQVFTKELDAPVVREITTTWREHHAYEKEFAVETRPTGRIRELPKRGPTELLQTYKEIICQAPRSPCAGAEGIPMLLPARRSC